jgi:hypothetical protein
VQSVKKFSDLVVLVDRLEMASRILSETLDSIMFLSSQVGEDKFPYENVPLTSPLKDLRKNRALAYMRLEGLLSIAVDRREGMLGELNASMELRVSCNAVKTRI